MTRGKGKKILSYSERQELASQKRDAENLLRDAKEEPAFKKTVDQAALSREIQHLDKELREGTAPRLTAVRKDTVHREVKELEEKLKDGLPSRAEMAHPGRYPGAVQKHMKWCRAQAENIERYKQLQRQLEPDAPANYETLRRDK